jgi:hypothetical protein
MPLAGVSHCGALLAWTTVPSAFPSWNLAGTVLAALNTLTAVAIWWAVSLIGCRHPVQRYTTL